MKPVLRTGAGERHRFALLPLCALLASLPFATLAQEAALQPVTVKASKAAVQPAAVSEVPADQIEANRTRTSDTAHLLSGLPVRSGIECRSRYVGWRYAAFATYASVPRTDLRYTAGEHLLAAYASSPGVVRRFCSVCGANIEWRGSAQYPGWVSIAVAALDTPFSPARTKHAHLDARAGWW